MPKKKLYGNRPDPRCETCLLGKASADGNSVLCRRGGVLPKFHQCKHYQYDPLKRVPMRRKVETSFSAEDFALEDWVTANEVVEEAATMATGTTNEDTLQKLRTYLEDSDSPDVNGIMAILSEVTDSSETHEVLNKRACAEESALTEEAVPESPEDIALEIAEDILRSEQATPIKEEHWTPDNTFDIDMDLQTVETEPATAPPQPQSIEEAPITVEANLNTASMQAAFSDLSMHLLAPADYEDDEDDDETVTTDDPSLLMFDTVADEEEDDILAENTLIFLSDEDLTNATIETLSMNEDGSLSVGMEEL